MQTRRSFSPRFTPSSPSLFIARVILPFHSTLQMREDAIREHLTPHPATVASNLHLAENAAQSEAAAAQSPAEAQAAHVIKTAADAAKALPEINAAIQQNEREYAFALFSCRTLSWDICCIGLFVTRSCLQIRRACQIASFPCPPAARAQGAFAAAEVSILRCLFLFPSLIGFLLSLCCLLTRVSGTSCR